MERLERATPPPKLESALMAHLDTAGRVRVQIEAMGRDLSEIRTAVEAAGGAIERSYANLAIASMPAATLEVLAGRSDVVFVQLPYRPVPDAIQGEEVIASGAAAWHSEGTDGAGIRVAIIDSSFAGYQGSVAAGELTILGPVDRLHRGKAASRLGTRDGCRGGHP